MVMVMMMNDTGLVISIYCTMLCYALTLIHWFYSVSVYHLKIPAFRFVNCFIFLFFARVFFVVVVVVPESEQNYLEKPFVSVKIYGKMDSFWNSEQIGMNHFVRIKLHSFFEFRFGFMPLIFGLCGFQNIWIYMNHTDTYQIWCGYGFWANSSNKWNYVHAYILPSSFLLLLLI